MEQSASRLRKTGEFYELDGEPIRRVVGRVRMERDPFDVLWELRESAMELLGGELPDDTYPDEPIRRTVGKTGALRCATCWAAGQCCCTVMRA